MSSVVAMSKGHTTVCTDGQALFCPCAHCLHTIYTPVHCSRNSGSELVAEPCMCKKLLFAGDKFLYVYIDLHILKRNNLQAAEFPTIRCTVLVYTVVQQNFAVLYFCEFCEQAYGHKNKVAKCLLTICMLSRCECDHKNKIFK